MQNHNLPIEEPLGLEIGHYEEPYSDIYRSKANECDE
jgi:hypothetical protein